MARSRARSAVKVGTRNTQSDIVSWLFISCTFLMFAGVIPRCIAWHLFRRLRPYGGDRRRTYRCIVGEHWG
jgi:hypothetical protein